jgi:hypothetical protein
MVAFSTALSSTGNVRTAGKLYRLHFIRLLHSDMITWYELANRTSDLGWSVARVVSYCLLHKTVSDWLLEKNLTSLCLKINSKRNEISFPAIPNLLGVLA